MEIVLPLVVDKHEGLDLPITMEIDSCKIYIENFSTSEKEWFFGIQGLKIEGESIHADRASSAIFEYRDFILTNYKIRIYGSTDNPADLQAIEWKLDFIFKILLGSGFPIHKMKDESDSMWNNAFGTQYHAIVSRRVDKTITKDLIDRAKILLQKIDLNDDKTAILRSLLDVAISQVGRLQVAGAFYVVLTESIVVPESGEGKSYKFATRSSKLRGEGKKYFEKMKGAYKKRSHVFHEGKNSFSVDEVKFIEIESCWFLEQYILNPLSFTVDAMDTLILANNEN